MADKMDDELANFDPMRDAYGDYMFNSYGNGYGQPQGAQTSSVFVQGIPLDTSLLGLKYLFEKAGAVLNIDKFYQPKNCNYRSGRVTYGSLHDASIAISLFHKKQPFNLSVQLYREQPSLMGITPGISGDYRRGDPPSIPSHSIRGAPVSSRGGQSRDSYRSRNQEIVNNISSEFQRMPLRQPSTFVDHSGAAPSTARGAHNASTGGANLISSFMNQTRGIASNGFRDSQSMDPVPPSTSGSSNAAPSTRKCLRCGAIALYDCTRCHEVYCSHECQSLDWNRHKAYCKNRATVNNVSATVKPMDNGSKTGQENSVTMTTANSTAATGNSTDDFSKYRQQNPSSESDSRVANEMAAGNRERTLDSPPVPKQQQQEQQLKDNFKQGKHSSGARPRTPASYKAQQGYGHRQDVKGVGGGTNDNRDASSKALATNFTEKCTVSPTTNFNGSTAAAKTETWNKKTDNKPPVQKLPTSQTNDRSSAAWPSAGSKAVVFVENIVDPWDFIAMRADRQEERQSISRDVQREVNPGTPLKLVSLYQVVAAKYSDDNQFYRAVVQKINADGSVTVLFIDWGNYETMSRDNLRPLSTELAIRPRNAFSCCLANAKPFGDDVNWNEMSIKAFRQMMVGMLVATCVDDSGSTISVLITNKEEDDVGEMLCSAKRASPRTYDNRAMSPVPALPTQKPTPPSSRPPRPHKKMDVRAAHLAKWKVGDDIQLYTPTPDGDSGLWMVVASVEDIQILQNLNDKCSVVVKSCDVREGTIVSAFSLESHYWYRAVVRSIAGNGSFTVQYLDYGNIETVDRVMPLPDEFSASPALAVHLTFPDAATCSSVCSGLTDDGLLVTVVDTSRIDEVKVSITMAMGSVEVSARSMWHEEFSPSPTLKAEHEDVAKSIVVAEYPIPREEVDVRPIYVEGPDSVHVMLETYDTLNQLQGALFAECEKPSLKTLSSLPLPGQPVCAKYSEDNKWYRGRVESGKMSVDAVPVRYIDYGNVEALPLGQLKPLLPQFATQPQMAISVRTQGTIKVSREKLTTILVSDQSDNWRMTVLDDTVRPISVRLSKHGRTLEQILAAEQKGIDLPSSKTPNPTKPKVEIVQLDVGKTVLLCLIDVLPGGIITGFQAQEKVVADMDRLCEEITARCERDPPPNSNFRPVLSDLVLAKLADDGRWYRCNVVNIVDGKTFVVLYADYGNVATVTIDDLRPFLPEFGWLPLQSVMSTLEGVVCDDEAKLECLRGLIKDQHFTVDVLYHKPDGIYAIKIPQLENDLKKSKLM